MVHREQYPLPLSLTHSDLVNMSKKGLQTESRGDVGRQTPGQDVSRNSVSLWHASTFI
jgi:hypothetical protein